MGNVLLNKLFLIFTLDADNKVCTISINIFNIKYLATNTSIIIFKKNSVSTPVDIDTRPHIIPTRDGGGD